MGQHFYTIRQIGHNLIGLLRGKGSSVSLLLELCIQLILFREPSVQNVRSMKRSHGSEIWKTTNMATRDFYPRGYPQVTGH